jgi:serine/threonine protein kinase
MSAEQAAMGVVDVEIRSVVYSLGVLLYELLTGSPPFARESWPSISAAPKSIAAFTDSKLPE